MDLQGRLDKCRRDLAKKFDAVPLYILLGINVTIYSLLGMMIMFMWNAPSAFQLRSGSDVTPLTDLPEYHALLWEFKKSKQDPLAAAMNRIEMDENSLFTRTVAVQRLHDFMRAATKQLYAEKYAADPDYQHIECIATFLPHTHDRLSLYGESVKKYLSNKESPTLYHQNLTHSLVQKVKVDASIQQGLPVWDDQDGLVAKKDIADYSLIGQYFGDEYLDHEFYAIFPWELYQQTNTGHPFVKKYEYRYAAWYDDDGAYGVDARYPVPNNTALFYDGYHDYHYDQYPNGQSLSYEESQQKVMVTGLLNDPRRNMADGGMTEEDMTRLNTEFVYCTVDGVIQSFVFATKDIPKGTQLFASYGSGYTIES